MSVRPPNAKCDAREKWKFMPAHIVLKNGIDRICEQHDTYSCGAIAVTHVLRLLGQDVKESIELDESRHIAKLMQLPWEDYFKNFVTSFIPIDKLPPVVAEHFEITPPDAVMNDSTPNDLVDGDDIEEEKEENRTKLIEGGTIQAVQKEVLQPHHFAQKEMRQPTKKKHEKYIKDSSSDESSTESDCEEEEREDDRMLVDPAGNDRMSVSNDDDSIDDSLSPTTVRFAPALRRAKFTIEAGAWDELDPKSLTVHELLEKLVLTIVSPSQRLWQPHNNVDVVIEPTRDDSNPDLVLKGCPSWLKPIVVGEYFPYVSLVRYYSSEEKWQIHLILGQSSKTGYIDTVPKQFFDYVFTTGFVTMVNERHTQWHRVIPDNYNWRNITKMEKIWKSTGGLTELKDEIPLAKLDLNSDTTFNSSCYFYDGVPDRVGSLMHVVMQRQTMLTRAITQSFNAYKCRGMIDDDPEMNFVTFNQPLWFGRILDSRGNFLCHRRLYREWVYKNIPTESIHIAIMDPHKWSNIQSDDSDDRHKDSFEKAFEEKYKSLRKRKQPVYIQERQKQISHILFKPYRKHLVDTIRTDFKLRRDEEYGCKLGWYMGLTEERLTECELLDYDWVVENINKNYAFQLTTKRWANRWIPLPAGASKIGDQRQKQRPRASTTVDCKVYPCQQQQFLKNFPVLQDLEIKGDWPDVRFRQKQGEATCIFMSMASALYYMSSVHDIPILRWVASTIADNAKYASEISIRTEDRVEKLKEMLNGTFVTKKKKTTKGAYPQLTENVHYFQKNSSHPFDPYLKQNQLPCPTLAVCLSIDNSREHAVTFFGNYVFDSNELKAFPITPEALNRCSPFGFNGVLQAWTFGMELIPKNNQKKRP